MQRLPRGELVPALGQGTWRIGDDHGRRQEEIDCLRRGIDLALTLINTAEMYGEGRSEALVGEAIEWSRAGASADDSPVAGTGCALSAAQGTFATPNDLSRTLQACLHGSGVKTRACGRPPERWLGSKGSAASMPG